jgi:two-component system, OmpR family, sensor kinase
VLSLAVLGWLLTTVCALRWARLARRLELVARADHELRGPVCALGLAVESLGRNPDLRRRAAALDAHLDRLRLGLADLGAALEGRRAASRPAEVRIDGLTKAATEAWEPAVRARGGEITFDWRAGPVVADADPARLSQALGNLVANAAEHGGPRITVVGERREKAVSITVRDSGRPRDPRLGRDAGRGRGLAIAAAAMADARGSLKTSSEHELRHPRRPAMLVQRAVVSDSTTETASRSPGTEFRLELPLPEVRAR